jgi:hypothetical protein
MEKIKQLLVVGGAQMLPETVSRAFNDPYSRQCLNSAALAIKTASSALAKSANIVTAIVNGVLVQKAASDMPALTGLNIANGSFGAVVFAVDVGGNLTAYFTNTGALANLVMPPIPTNVAVIGQLVIQNGTGSAFTGGTTALDTASLTVTYINQVGPFYPNAAF